MLVEISSGVCRRWLSNVLARVRGTNETFDTVISFSAFSYVLLYDSTCRIQFSRLPAMAVRSFVRSIELLNAELFPKKY